MATHARITSRLLPATSAPAALLCSGPQLDAVSGPAPISDADAAIDAIRVGIDRFLTEQGTVETARGVAYFRRGAWAAFLHSGQLVGQFATVREASAALGGAA